MTHMLLLPSAPPQSVLLTLPLFLGPSTPSRPSSLLSYFSLFSLSLPHRSSSSLCLTPSRRLLPYPSHPSSCLSPTSSLLVPPPPIILVSSSLLLCPSSPSLLSFTRVPPCHPSSSFLFLSILLPLLLLVWLLLYSSPVSLILLSYFT